MEIEIGRTAHDASVVYTAKVGNNELLNSMHTEIVKQFIMKVSDILAQEFVEKHGSEILGKISQDAIATLTIAQGANAVKDMLDKKLPDKIETIVKREVYQRGVFSGMTKIG